MPANPKAPHETERVRAGLNGSGSPWWPWWPRHRSWEAAHRHRRAPTLLPPRRQALARRRPAAVDLPGTIADCDSRTADGPNRRRRGWTRPCERRAPEWVLAQLLTANRAARRHDRRRLGAGRRGQSGPPRAGHAGRRHDLSGDVTDAIPDEIRAMTVVATTVVGRVAACGDTALCAED
jgi:hypothetical protein